MIKKTTPVAKKVSFTIETPNEAVIAEVVAINNVSSIVAEPEALVVAETPAAALSCTATAEVAVPVDAAAEEAAPATAEGQDPVVAAPAEATDAQPKKKKSKGKKSAKVIVEVPSVTAVAVDKENASPIKIVGTEKHHSPLRSALATKNYQSPNIQPDVVESVMPKKCVTFVRAPVKTQIKKRVKKMSNVDSDKLLAMTAAFERMLTNAATLEHQLACN